MTWAIAMAGFPMGGVLLADVRVSFVDTKSRRVVGEVDGLQKVHRVGENLGVAFAGSVEAGFALVDDLRRSLTGIEPGYVWSPARVAVAWSRRLRRTWGDLPQSVRSGGCELLLVGAFPASESSFCHSDAYLFRAPEFSLERLRRGHASSIGSGSGVETYAEMIESFAGEWAQLAQFSLQPFPAGPAGPMSVVLGELIQKNPSAGVSSQLVLCLVEATKTAIFTVGSPRSELATPPLAADATEFRELCQTRGFQLSAAVAPSSHR